MNLNRRSLIASTVSAAALSQFAMANMFADESASGKRRFTIDLRWGSIGVKANQNEAIELAEKHGFESVAASPQALAALTNDENAELLAELKRRKLVWGSSGLPVQFREDEARFKKDLAELPRLAAALQRAGVDRMGTWIMPGHDDLTYLENFKQHASRLREIAKVLQNHGLRFGLEYVGTPTLRHGRRYSFVHTMKETAELHEAIGVSNMGFVLDTWHWYTAGETADDIRSLDAKQIVGCDLNDAPTGIPIDEQLDNRRELPVATGVIDTKSFVQALIDVGYDGPVRAEPFNQALNRMDNDPACAAVSKALHAAVSL
ncbi:sugar phosphate isomerase/epimerase family protein [Roseiconus lacunae]|uniref:Sugar phosphate isomerase/epimerase family protein n=1 Tax=Roseiconus lacunae TaxID=2605694 RepID=A0ABT7PMD6_9BACT|nr:sugar phosphate isomerase/epimerase family protein [Roseiconus lacunae]MDM4017670.1 sugar phosphate isomerase/epimerase family protein [Roseiconus lacunae]